MDIREDANTPIILGRSFLATAGAIIDVKRGKLTFEVGEEKIEFILTQFMKAPAVDDECYMLDVIEECRREIEKDQTKYSEILKTPTPQTHNHGEDDLAESVDLMPQPVKPTLELKALLENLRYEFLDKDLERPVIVSADLGKSETEKLLNILRKYPTALGYNITDLKGISPSICMHRIMLEGDGKTSREPQRRINPDLSEVVKKEVQKLLEE
jgi:hypothetical protein